MLAAVADEQDALLPQLGAAADAGAEAVGVVVVLEDGPGRPVRALDDPRDDVLEAAEHRALVGHRLAGAKSGVGLDLHATPAARLRCARHCGRNATPRPGGFRVSSGPWRTPSRSPSSKATRPGRSCSSSPCGCSTPRCSAWSW